MADGVGFQKVWGGGVGAPRFREALKDFPSRLWSFHSGEKSDSLEKAPRYDKRMNCGCWYLPRGCSGFGTNLAAFLQCNPVTPTSAGTRRGDSLPILPFRVTGDIPGPGRFWAARVYVGCWISK